MLFVFFTVISFAGCKGCSFLCGWDDSGAWLVLTAGGWQSQFLSARTGGGGLSFLLTC